MRVHSETQNNTERHLFDSSNVLCITYSERTMVVTYGKGHIYTYKDVPRYVFLQISSAPSQGISINTLIRSEGRGKDLYQETRTGTLSPDELKTLKDEIRTHTR